ncbi:hypothetical protein [Helicobacter sp. T3_23-1056]
MLPFLSYLIFARNRNISRRFIRHCEQVARLAWQSTKEFCHTEGVARSISKSKNVSRDILLSRAQYDKENSVIVRFCDFVKSCKIVASIFAKYQKNTLLTKN